MNETQLKVFEFAKEIGVETLTLMDKIREWKLPVRSHMATLDEAMQAEIRTRLQQAADQAASKTKRKGAVRKKAADAAPAAAVPPVKKAAPAAAASTAAGSATVPEGATAAGPATPAPAQKKTGLKKKAPAATEGKTAKAGTKAAAKVVKPASVIRRKAGEAEAAAEAAAAAALLAAETQAASGEELPADAELGAATEGEAPVAGPQAGEGVKRRNIVGRMDLRRVANITPQRGGGASGGGGGTAGTDASGAPRVSRTAPRNIRTGFFSADSMTTPEPASGFSAREREEKAKKQRPVAAPREAEAAPTFTATEFRKREVIFQPKKKKSVMGRESKKTQLTTPAAHKRVVEVNGTMTLNNLAMEIGVKAPALMKKLMAEGIQSSMNQALDFDTVALIVPEFGWEAINTLKTEAELVSDTAFGEMDAERITRPPVVTVMGHVDHGKTSLLDAIRKAKVAEGEAGGITQHIGAYSVTLDSGHKVTFIDTPGHEAFTAMRARGANATDIAVIVVAADDGVMPQTAEAINHAKAAKVPIIVAVNKMDKPGANPDRIKQQLTEFELVPEEWGGTTIYCPVSALKGTGIKELLDQIHVVAEVQELKANPKRSGTGIVIESRMEKGRGTIATILVQDGTVSLGQIIVAGKIVGRVRNMSDDKGVSVKHALPGMPVEVLGLPEPPMAGDRFDIAKDDESARLITAQRMEGIIKEELPSSKMTLEQLFSRVKSGDVKELSLVIKSDVAGSLEAIKGMIDKISTPEVKVKVIHAAVGGITESDVLLSGSSKGVIVGFNVRPDAGAARLAKERGIEIKSYSIIYELVDDLKKSLGGMLAPTVTEKSMGRAEVRNIFVVPKMGTIAGCFVTEGKIARSHMLRLVRDGKIIYEGKVGSLKRFKDDAKEVASGFECGIGIENFNDIKVGDVIEAFVKEETVRELK